MSTRESGFLPTIKCSQCGSQVEISMMGDHICSGDSETSQLSPPPEADESFGKQPNPQPRLPRKPVGVDTGAANRPFMRHDPLTPVSHHSDSPRTPYSGLPSARSTEYFSNATGTSPESARRPSGYGGPSDGSSYTTDPMPSPGASVFQRMENLVPGPFDHRATEVVSPLRKRSLTPSATFPGDRPGTANSHLSAASGESLAAPRPHKASYDGFGPPSRAESGPEQDMPALGYLIRSETFPRPSDVAGPPARTPSAPGTRRESSRRSAMGSTHIPSMGPDTSRRPPPRKSLIPAAHKNAGSVDLAKEFGASNPYHTPSDSASSGYSGFSQPSHPSSQTSPARSPPRRQPSHDLRIEQEVETAAAPAAMSPATSPRDYGAQHPSTETASPARSDSLLRTGLTPQAPQVVRRGTGDVSSRGDCKGCSQPIVGKSISSADGRLTGRYHKACFVCSTCAEPFSSAEFYVLNDKPYCEQHYHKLNGSLCGGCGRGIEGKFVADEASVKYHLRCFCCADCGHGLTDGYFEVDGRAYCEQDAWNRVNSVPAPTPRNGPGNYRPYQPDPGLHKAAGKCLLDRLKGWVSPDVQVPDRVVPAPEAPGWERQYPVLGTALQEEGGRARIQCQGCLIPRQADWHHRGH
ncbi:Paxillin-like protein-like protein [Emericellopsis cladophorae]|uniref:Paxillin-like protein-like protein n=1 Tax=Emericellopsis cladophorae TaxID=2686198 RepID=A0A9Q0BEB5_9HYPO|nr:Paxillin-like protein-like protein [Emericellopsis cladophorae]KAI6781686.1 Paxillin-like protein-like protein [Emericellopsis cladophorae]